MSDILDVSDFAGMAPEVLGRGNRTIHATPGMVNHQNIVAKNAEASRKRAATTALRRGGAQVTDSESLPNMTPSSTSQGQALIADQSTQAANSLIQPIQHFPILSSNQENSTWLVPSLSMQNVGYTISPNHANNVTPLDFAVVPNWWNASIPPAISPSPSQSNGSLVPTNGMLNHMVPNPVLHFGNHSQQTSPTTHLTGNHPNTENGTMGEQDDSIADGDLRLLNELTPDIRSTPVALPVPKTPLQRVQANGMTLTPTRPARNLTYRSHAIEPEGSSPLPIDKENIPLIPPNLAAAAQTLGKRAAQSPVRDDVIEAPMATEDSDEGESEDQPKKKKLKWSLRSLQLTTARQRILQGSYLHLRYLLITIDPWVVDAEADETAIKAWYMQLDYLIDNARYRDRPAPTLEEIDVIKQRRAQHRGEIKTAARLFVCHPVGELGFRFATPMDAQSIAQNRNLVEALRQRMGYTFRDHVTRQGMFETPLLSQVINKVYFDNGKKSEGLAFFGTGGEIPLPVIALVLTAILCAIDEWKSGKHDPKSAPFTKTLYEESYKNLLTSLRNWETYCRDKMNQPQIPLEFRQKLYAQGKHFAGIIDDEPGVATSTEEDVFTAADFAANYYTPGPDAPGIA